MSGSILFLEGRRMMVNCVVWGGVWLGGLWNRVIKKIVKKMIKINKKEGRKLKWINDNISIVRYYSYLILFYETY